MHSRCGGLIAAVPNDVCGVGVAYGSQVAGIRILDGTVTDLIEGRAFIHQPHVNSIYSCRYSPSIALCHSLSTFFILRLNTPSPPPPLPPLTAGGLMTVGVWWRVQDPLPWRRSVSAPVGVAMVTATSTSLPRAMEDGCRTTATMTATLTQYTPSLSVSHCTCA